MTAVKICGVCSPGDAALVAELGADYIGVILAPGRSRTRTEREARSIYTAAAGVRRVGVFVDADLAELRRAAERLRLDVVQLHGAETPACVEAIRAAGCRVWKAVRVQSAAAVQHALEQFGSRADALLLDGFAPGHAGGAGVTFDWSAVAPLRERWPASLQLVAAGGLNAGNLADAIVALRPDVVDVSSGVEDRTCIKSRQKLTDFITVARAAGSRVVAE